MASGVPSTASAGASSPVRSEYLLIQAVFDKFPALAGNDLRVVRVAQGAAVLETVTVSGTGSVAMTTSPVFTTPSLRAATATTINMSGQITNTVSIATPPCVITSTTQVPNLYVARAALADTATTATTATTVTTNANLTGPITSAGNATSVAAQTGTGSTFVMQASPVLTTPKIGVATPTSVNKVAITQPAAGSTLTVADGKTLTASNTLAFAGTDGSTLNIGTGGTLNTGAYANISLYALLANPVFTGTVTADLIAGNRVSEGNEALTPGAGAGATVNWGVGGSKLTNNGTNALTFSNIPATGLTGHLLDCSNLSTTTFPGATNWGVGGKPSINGRALVSMITNDGGTTVLATVIWQAV